MQIANIALLIGCCEFLSTSGFVCFFVGKSYGGFVFQADSKHGILFCVATNH